jgi:DNA-directed RNA polymerase subunit M/transcription elongation factor TFIIS
MSKKDQDESSEDSDSSSDSDDNSQEDIDDEKEKDRENGIKALKTVIKEESNIVILEKTIFNLSEKLYDGDQSKDQSKDYKRILYQVIGDIINKKKLGVILKELKGEKILWDHCIYDDIKNKLEEVDSFIIKPFEVVEGVSECERCGSKRTITCQKQNRSSDEPMSTICQCLNCKAKWVYSG